MKPQWMKRLVTGGCVLAILLVLAILSGGRNQPKQEANEESTESAATNSETMKATETEPMKEEEAKAETQTDASDRQTVTIKEAEFILKLDESFATKINASVVNNTKYGITGYQRGMLAFDKEGNPLSIYWIGMDSSVPESYYHLHKTKSANISPGEDTGPVGWSLESMRGEKANRKYAEIAFVLYCFKEIYFEDGHIWENPNYEKWLETYKGQKANVDGLSAYYPYVQSVEGFLQSDTDTELN